MKRISVIFKTHLDIGFTALAAEVSARYPGHIRAAVATAAHFRAKDPSPTGFRYRWTVGSWLVDSILQHGRPVAEHTCGVDVKKYLKDRRHWSGAAIRDLGGEWIAPFTPKSGDGPLGRSGSLVANCGQKTP